MIKKPYINIIVSGSAGTGKSTLAKNLAQSLHFEYIGIGELQRKFDSWQNRNDHQGAIHRNQDHEKNIDRIIIDLATKQSNIIIDSWLAGFLCRNLVSTYRILTICSDLNMLINRIAKRDKLSLDKAKNYVEKRINENKHQWMRMYNTIDFWNPSYFHFIADTAKSSISDYVNLIIKDITSTV